MTIRSKLTGTSTWRQRACSFSLFVPGPGDSDLVGYVLLNKRGKDLDPVV